MRSGCASSSQCAAGRRCVATRSSRSRPGAVFKASKMSNSKEGSSCPDGYRALSTAELRELLQSNDKMDQIIRLNEKFQELQVDREMLLTTNRSLAEVSLARRPRFNNGKLQLAEKYKELSGLVAACWEKQSQLEARGQKRSLQTAQNLLQEEVARGEEHSEMTENWTWCALSTSQHMLRSEISFGKKLLYDQRRQRLNYFATRTRSLFRGVEVCWDGGNSEQSSCHRFGSRTRNQSGC